MPTKVDHKTKSEKIELIDTLLEDASEILVDLKRVWRAEESRDGGRQKTVTLSS